MDFDGDGRIDVLSGSWPGEIYLFRRTDDGFAAPEILKDAEGEPINVGSAAAAFAFDWDADGDLDLLVGTIEGHVHLVPNEGTANAPAWGAATRLQAQGEDIEVGHGDAGPFVADWDGDGLPDLVVGAGSGEVIWYRNSGTREAPELETARTLVSAGESRSPDDAETPRRGTRSKICVADYNADGRLDLLVGDFSMTETKLAPLTKEQEQEREAVQERYGKIVQRYLNVR
ncbi:MAG TPA: VCBS repeat-containing protein, partial [Planctomycetaceae bacterium]|nr:VCBS repeat-containing protein [Planctomycetaceae bacterium]